MPLATKLGHRPTVGYLAPGIYEDNSLAIWSGIVEVARAADVNVLCFAGNQLREPRDFSSQANAIFELVDTTRLDGLVIWTSSLSSYVGRDAIQRFCAQFRPLPIIAIGMTLPGIPGVLLDSYGGMRTLVTHLIADHGRRRLAYISGPAGHREAVERYRAYCDILAESGLPLDPALVTPPYPWDEQFGQEAITLLLDERQAQFDAIVSVNDELALGALRALLARGVRVPDDVALVGFNNTRHGRIVSPSLTTVPIRMQERGRQALRMLLARLAGEAVPEEVMLPTHPVLRRSCGCPDAAVAQAAAAITRLPSGGPAEASGTAQLAAVRPRIIEAMEQALETSAEAPRGMADLGDAFLTDVLGGTLGAFLALLESRLREVVEARGDVLAWQGTISALRRAALPCLLGHDPLLLRAEGLWHAARVMIGRWAWHAQAHGDWLVRQQANGLYAIGRGMTASGGPAEMMDILARELPQLGISSCYVALYEERGQPTEWCRLALAFDATGRAALDRAGQRIRARELASGLLLPAGCSQQLVVMPLYFRDEHLGFLMLAGSWRDGAFYQELQGQISSALKSVLLLEENIALYHQAIQAQQVAQEGQSLAEEASQLKSRFLSVVSHELLTPLVLLVGLSEMMLRESPGNRPALPEPYRQDLARIHISAQQLGGLVRDVLDLARSQVGQLKLTKKAVDLGEVLKPVILVGEEMARSKGLAWQAEIAPDLPPVSGDPARLQQVALNLVTNAVKFTERGQVCLRVEANAEAVTASVSDTGLGVPLAEQEVIFDEFRQSERTATRGYGGLGVGLAICRQLVLLHGGEIGVRSSGEENGGATFFFTLPAMTEGLAEGGGAPLPSQEVLLLTAQAGGGEPLQAHLSRQGFQVERLVVGEGDAWLPQVLAARPGAVVLDLQPTSELGWQLVALLKQNPATQDIPVLFYTLREERDAGSMLAFDYLVKPMGAAALAHALQRLGLDSARCEDDRKILVVDDDPAILALHSHIVQTHFPDCQVLTAENGRRALEILRDHRPTLVLLDLMMPELDGAGVMAAMQADARLHDIPVIVLTAQSLTQEEMARLNRGVAAVLQKGVFTVQETLAHIEQALARDRRLGSEMQRLVRKAMAFIHEHYSEPISREEIAAAAGVSPRHLTRSFAQETGVTPIDYLNRYRVAQARRLLDEADERNITEVMGAAGFADSSYFARVFRREVGVSPSAYQRGERPHAS